jgi:cell division protein FtsQ
LSMEVSGPSLHQPAHIDPRFRARRIAVQRGMGRRRLQRLVDAAVVLAVALGFLLALRTPLLDVDAVRVSGNERTPAEAVIAASGIAQGDQLIDIDLGAAGQGVTDLPWVSQARLHRGIDGSVSVEVVERTPVAVVGEGAEALLVDAEGRALGPAFGDPSHTAALVAIEGVGAGLDPGEFLGGRAADALAVAASLGSTLDVGLRLVVEDGRLAGVVDPGISVVFGDAGQLEAKIRALRTVLEQVDLTCAATIDVRSPGSPVLTREEGCS